MTKKLNRTQLNKVQNEGYQSAIVQPETAANDPLAALQEAGGNAAASDFLEANALEEQAERAEKIAGSNPAVEPAADRPSGEPLSPAAQAHFEETLGQPLNGVRIHADARAANAAEQVDARAFTVGHDIYFGPGQYAPQRTAGQQLLAHELAHAAQYSEGAATGLQRKPKQALNDLSPKEKGEIRVITDPVLSSYQPFFSSQTAKTSVNLPSNVTAVFSPGIDKALEAGLQSVAGDISTGKGAKLVPDSSVTLALDLSKHNSDHAAYRFTWIAPAKGQGGEILIERLGPVGSTKLSKPQEKAADAIIKTRGITMSGFGTDEEEKIRMALAALPQTGQDNLQGLKFSRINGVDATDPDTGGDYDPDTHTITLYDPAFQTSLSRVGDSTAGISTMDVRAVVHEIGHVMDLYKFNDVYNQAAQMSSVSAGKKLLKAARSPSGHRWSQEKVPGEKEKKWMQVQITAKDAKTHDFRQAVKADGGKEVTNYAATDWMESYAESYSLFVTDPERLKALRPKVYEYFKIKFPN